MYLVNAFKKRIARGRSRFVGVPAKTFYLRAKLKYRTLDLRHRGLLSQLSFRPGENTVIYLDQRSIPRHDYMIWVINQIVQSVF